MNVTFELDGVAVGTYQRQAKNKQWTYNASVFFRDGLDNTEHTLVISPQGQDGPTSASSSYLVFDYITYVWVVKKLS